MIIFSYFKWKVDRWAILSLPIEELLPSLLQKLGS
jgi:hypothetical protein